MLRLRFAALSVVLFTLVGSQVVAQSPVVYNHYVPRPTVDLAASAGYVDIPGSQHTLTVPAGTAFITWSIRGSVVCTLGFCPDTTRFRPVIGANFPTEGIPDTNEGTSSGSWAIHTTAGNLTVKLQIAAPYSMNEYESRFIMDSSESFSQHAMSWTLIVFPDAANAGVPTVGGVGLGVLVLLLLGAGSLIIAKRSKPLPA